LTPGLLIGLLAEIKSNFLIWPCLLILRGAWLVTLVAFIVFALFSLLPLLVFGSTVYTQWIEMLLVYKAASLATILPFAVWLPGWDCLVLEWFTIILPDDVTTLNISSEKSPD